MKEHIDTLYADGRVTLMTDNELEEIFVNLTAAQKKDAASE
jgi:hypothetical protein